jgi:transposase
MALDEQKRQEMAKGLEQGLGPRTSELVMEHLTALGDLTAKVDALDKKVDALDHKVEILRHEMTAEIHRVGRNQTLGIAATMAIFNTGLFAVAAWIRF